MYYREQWLRRLRGNTEELLFERVFKRRHRVLLQWGTGRKCVNLSLQCTRIPFPHSTESLWQRRAMVGHETPKWKESIQCYMQRYLVMYFTCFSILKLKCFEYGFHCISKCSNCLAWWRKAPESHVLYGMKSVYFNVKHPFFCPPIRGPLSCPPSAWQWTNLAQRTVVQGRRAANVFMW